MIFISSNRANILYKFHNIVYRFWGTRIDQAKLPYVNVRFFQLDIATMFVDMDHNLPDGLKNWISYLDIYLMFCCKTRNILSTH